MNTLWIHRAFNINPFTPCSKRCFCRYNLKVIHCCDMCCENVFSLFLTNQGISTGIASWIYLSCQSQGREPHSVAEKRREGGDIGCWVSTSCSQWLSPSFKLQLYCTFQFHLTGSNKEHVLHLIGTQRTAKPCFTLRWLNTISLNFSTDVPLVGVSNTGASLRGSGSSPSS